MTADECSCADCDLPAGHGESPDYDPEDFFIRLPPKSVRHYRPVPLAADEENGP